MSKFEYSPPIRNLFWEIYDRWIAPGVVPALESDLHGKLVPSASSGEHFLDVGPGGGQHSVRIAKDRPDLRVTGIDIEPVLINRAQRLAKKMDVDDRVTFMYGDALEIPFEDESFDYVICAGPIKQVEDKARALSECLRVLRPNGRLLAMDVDRGCRVQDVNAMVDRTPLRGPFKAILRNYFIGWVAAYSIDLDEMRELWTPLGLDDCDGPRRIPDSPAWVAVGTKR